MRNKNNPPAIMQHFHMIIRKQIVAATEANGFEAEVSIGRSDEVWSIEVRVDTPEHGMTILRLPAVRSHGRWCLAPLRIEKNGEDKVVDGDIQDALAELLQTATPKAGDTTKALHGGTHGSRSNGVEVRKATVIRN